MWHSGGSRAVSLPSTCFDSALAAGKLKAILDTFALRFKTKQSIKTTSHRPKRPNLAIKSSARIRVMKSWIYRQARWSPSLKRFHTKKESREGTRTRLLASSLTNRSESWLRASTSWVRLKIACLLWSRGLKVSNSPGRALQSKRPNLVSRCDSKVKVKWIIHLNQKRLQLVNQLRHPKIRSRAKRRWNVCRRASSCELSSWTLPMAFQSSSSQFK